MTHIKLYEEYLNEGAVKQFDKDVETLIKDIKRGRRTGRKSKRIN